MNLIILSFEKEEQKSIEWRQRQIPLNRSRRYRPLGRRTRHIHQPRARPGIYQRAPFPKFKNRTFRNIRSNSKLTLPLFKGKV